MLINWVGGSKHPKLKNQGRWGAVVVTLRQKPDYRLIGIFPSRYINLIQICRSISKRGRKCQRHMLTWKYKPETIDLFAMKITKIEVWVEHGRVKSS